MLVVHNLNDSRSHRILWLLEELGAPYEIKSYQRDPKTRLAPPELEAVHPLGKSPVITDGNSVIIESGAITDYIVRHYGKGAMQPRPGTVDYERYMQWLHYFRRLGHAAADAAHVCRAAGRCRKAGAASD